MRKFIIAALTALLVGAGVGALAHEHEGEGGKHKHSNLQAAMEMLHHAEKRIDAAQKANEFDLGGHAQKAKDLLAQADSELKAAGVQSDEDEDKKDHDEDKDDDHGDDHGTGRR